MQLFMCMKLQRLFHMDIQLTNHHLSKQRDPLCFVVYLCYNSGNLIYLGLFLFNLLHWSIDIVLDTEILQGVLIV